MQTFSNFSKKINEQKMTSLIEESIDLGITQDTDLLESINTLCDNLILANLMEATISDSDITDMLDQIPLDADELADFTIQSKNNVLIINWDGKTAKLEIDGNVLEVPGDVRDIEALKGAVEGMLQDFEYPVTEQANQGYISSLLDGKEIEIDGVKVSLSKEKDGLIINGNFKKFPGTPGLEFDMNDAISVMLDDIGYYVEEITQDDIADVLYNIPTDTKSLSGKEFDIAGDKLTVDWDAESGVIKAQVNGEDVEIKDKAYDLETLSDLLMKAIGSDSEEKPEPKEEKPVTDKEIKKKLAVLNTIIKPRLINKFANNETDRKRMVDALTDYIKTGSDESKATTELDQRALVDLLFDMIDVLTVNRNLASLVTKNATSITASFDPNLNESIILEAKKKAKKKAKTSEESVDAKLDMLLKLGLVDNKLYARAKRALSNKKSAGTVPYLRNLLFDLLDKLISYIKKDPTLYNRIRINVMKEMKGILPTKKEIEEATCAGRKAAQNKEVSEVPESYSKHYFTKEAWLEGYNSWDGTYTDTEEEEMKTFKEFQESISISEIDVINDAINELSGLSGKSYETLEAATEDINGVLAKVGLMIPGLDEASTELPLESVDGEGATLSVFSDESLEDKIEGDLFLRYSISSTDSGYTVDPEIVAYFDDEEAVSLSDIEFEPEESENQEMKMNNMKEAIIDSDSKLIKTYKTAYGDFKLYSDPKTGYNTLYHGKHNIEVDYWYKHVPDDSTIDAIIDSYLDIMFDDEESDEMEEASYPPGFKRDKKDSNPANVSKNDKTLSKILKVLTELTTSKVSQEDLKDFEMYFYSPKRLAVREIESLMPEAWFKDGGSNLTSTGFSNVKELAAFLKLYGVKERKKPATKKPTYSLYDETDPEEITEEIDDSWYKEYKSSPLYVKVNNPNAPYANGRFKINNFEKESSNTVRITMGDYSAIVDLNDPQKWLKFYSGKMPITAKQAFNLFQYKNGKSLTEEFIDGQTFVAVLLKNNTRSYVSAIISAKSEEDAKKIVELQMDGYTLHSIYPVKVTDTTK